MTVAATSLTRRGRPSAMRLGELLAQVDDSRDEIAARRQEATALVAAIRFTASALERLAWSPEGDPRVIDHAGRLRAIADRYERRWAPGAAA